jgi:hypothetical protein
MKTQTNSIDASPRNGADTITAVVCIDLGDKHSAYCVLDRAGASIGEGVVKTSPDALKAVFGGAGRMRIATPTHGVFGFANIICPK